MSASQQQATYRFYGGLSDEKTYVRLDAQGTPCSEDLPPETLATGTPDAEAQRRVELWSVAEPDAVFWSAENGKRNADSSYRSPNQAKTDEGWSRKITRGITMGFWKL